MLQLFLCALISRPVRVRHAHAYTAIQLRGNFGRNIGWSLFHRGGTDMAVEQLSNLSRGDGRVGKRLVKEEQDEQSG